MNSERLSELLKQHGFNVFAGVPCSTLQNLLNNLMRDPEVVYIPATREDEAIGIAVGTQLGGLKPLVFMQNAGLGLSINAIASLVQLYRIPLLFLIGWRGATNRDAPEHLLMGKYTVKLLETMQIPTYILEGKDGEETLLRAHDAMKRSSGPVALLIREGVIE